MSALLSWINSNKKTIIITAAVIVLLILAAVSGYVFGLRYGNRSSSTVGQSVQRAGELNEQAGKSVDGAAASVSSADGHIDRATGTIDQAADTAAAVQGRVSDSQTGLKHCQELAQECSGLNSRAKSILAAAQPKNQSGTQAGKTAATSDWTMVNTGISSR